MAGSAAAVLIGLIFVVVTLMQNRTRSSVLSGAKLYMGPVLLHISFVLVLSAAALTPGISTHAMAIVAAVVALWGLGRGLFVIRGINALKGNDSPHWSDVWCYGVIPTVLYASMLLVAGGLWAFRPWAPYAIAMLITGLLLVTIRNEWDLVTWLAPRPDEPEHEPTFESIEHPRAEHR
jgi:hypothetical protein